MAVPGWPSSHIFVVVVVVVSHRARGSATSNNNKLCGKPPQYAPPPVTLTFDLLTLKVVSELRETWATSVPILVFLGLSVLDL